MWGVQHVWAPCTSPELTKPRHKQPGLGASSMLPKHSSRGCGSGLPGEHRRLEPAPGSRELKRLLAAFLGSCFNLLSFPRTAPGRQPGWLLRHTNETHPSASVIARLSFLLEVRDERSGQVLSRLQYLIISKHARWPQAVKATSI